MPHIAAQALDPKVRDDIDETIEHFNANHADTVLLLVRFAAGCPEATEAEALAVDTLGAEFAVVIGSGDRARSGTARADFAAPVATVDEVYTQVYALVAAARARAGEAVPLTSIEREAIGQRNIATYVTEVVSVADLTPNLREIVIGGPGLAEFDSLGGDQFAYVMAARPGDSPLPDDYSMADFMAAAAGARPFGAYYTVRHWNPERSEITLWAVVHGHAGGVGGWFAHCAPGDRLALWGAREGFWSDGVYTPAGDPQHHLFVTDESGFCAVAALVELLPPGDTATVLAETIDAAHTIEFPGARTNVRWHYRGEQPPGTGTGLLDMVRATVGHAGPLATAFGAGESRQLTAIRKYLRREVGMPARSVSMTGYWRRDES